jgi:transcriptional regulator with XRE-family HTH domain
MERKGHPVDRHIGTRIRMRRLQLGMTQGELGEALGVSFQQVQKYEKGLNRVGGSNLAAIADKLGVAVGFFYQGAPGQEGAQPASAEALLMDQFIASRDGLIIARAFVQISSPKVRAIVASSIAALLQAAMEPERRQVAAE